MTCEVFVSDGPGKEYSCKEEAVSLIFNGYIGPYRVCAEHAHDYGSEVRAGLMTLEPIRP